MSGLEREEGSAREVFLAFLVLGLTAFGGPVAHLGYFRTAFVARRRWLSDAEYSELVALCQFLPGPSSSQVGMALGLRRAGALGMLAAFAGFTLPSGLLMGGLALGLAGFGVDPDAGWLAGLKAAAVAVVLHALIGMGRTLTPDASRLALAAGVAFVMLALPFAITQVLVMGLGALVGLALLAPASAAPGQGTRPLVPRSIAAGASVLFLALLVALPVLAALVPAIGLADGVYRAGALVFGGGHVVLPLLEGALVGNGGIARELFLAGYGAVQGVPGPLFSLGAYLGALSPDGPGGVAGALVGLVFIFLPGALILVAALPVWSALQRSVRARKALAGVNAAVVGLLAAAFYDPVLVAGIIGPGTALVAGLAFAALLSARIPVPVIVAAAALGAELLADIGFR